MTSLKSQLESLLLVSSKPMTVKKLAELLQAKSKEVQAELEALAEKYNQKDSGINLQINNDKVQLASSPENSELIKAYLKDDLTGELTDPAIETLTIIAYRQPISKAELEQIRGVNCSLILRNLMIRGLTEAEYSKDRGATVYSVTLEFLKYLGLNKNSELPDFDKLNSHENLNKLLSQDNSQVEGKEDVVIKVEVKKE